MFSGSSIRRSLLSVKTWQVRKFHVAITARLCLDLALFQPSPPRKRLVEIHDPWQLGTICYLKYFSRTTVFGVLQFSVTIYHTASLRILSGRHDRQPWIVESVVGPDNLSSGYNELKRDMELSPINGSLNQSQSQISDQEFTARRSAPFKPDYYDLLAVN